MAIAKRRMQLVDGPSPALTEYEADCLAGRRFPNPGDIRMQERCRETLRFWELLELFRRFHMQNLSRETHYECCIRNYFPSLIDLKPSELTRQAVIQWLTENGQRSKVQANHAFILLRLLYRKARDWELYEGRNPTDGIKRYRLPSRSRFAHHDEMPRFLEALQYEPEHIQVFYLLSLLVACRPGEARFMKWDHLRFTNELIREQLPDGTYQERQIFAAAWNKPTTKTGVPHSVPLPSELATRVHALPRFNEWVFSGADFHCRRKAPGPMSTSMVHKHWTPN
jgi:integrase